MKELLPDIERWRQQGQKVAVATSTDEPLSTPLMLGLTLAGVGLLLLLLRPVRHA